jgi:hypothetical protein
MTVAAKPRKLTAIERCAIIDAEFAHAADLPVYLAGDDGRDVLNAAAGSYHERVYFTDRTAELAARSNQRDMDACPLFAAQIPQTATPEHLTAQARTNAEQWQALILRQRGLAQVRRILVAAMVEPVTLAGMDARRFRMPADPCYGCEFWSDALRAVAAGIPCYHCGSSSANLPAIERGVVCCYGRTAA